MADSHFQRVKELFAAVAAMPAGERASFLEVACAGDTKLRAEVQSLLNAQAPIEESDVVEPISEAPGMRIGPYKLLERIGEGTFGVVFMAEQEEPVRRRVALKVLKLGMDTKQVVARFEQERQALALMDHPNIAKVLDAGATSSGRPFFVMELVRGDPITEYCDREKLPTRDRLAIFVDVCRAVQHAHHKGVIHRDLKPSNVLVTLVDGRPVAKVIDFGVAKALHGPLTARTLFTEFRQMIGTPLYMSPEQAEMSGVDIDTRSDLYSLGVMLYELLTGTTPITREQMVAAGLAELHRTIREVEPPKPSTRLATLGAQGTDIAARRGTEVRRLGLLLRGDLDWIVMKCLEKDRTRRYETPIGLVEDLLRHLSGEAVHAAPPSAMYQIQKFVRRKKGLVSASAAVVLTALVGVGAFALKAEDAKNEALARGKAESARAADARHNEAAQRQLAESERAARQDAELQKGRFESLADASSFSAYVANVAAARASLQLDSPATARRRLDACSPRFRGWEWRHLDSECDESILTLRGHEGRVYRAIFDSRGSRIVSYGEDATARVWDAETGDCLHILRHAERLSSIAISPDGSRIATASHDKTIRIWDMRSGREMHTLRGHREWATKVVFSGDGRNLATGGGDEAVRLWDVETGRLLREFGKQRPWVEAITFSADGRLLGTASQDCVARVWELSSGKLIFELRGHEGWVVSMTFSRRGEFVLTSSGDYTARVWSLSSGEQVHLLRAHNDEVQRAEFDSQNQRIMTLGGDRDGLVYLWDRESGRLLSSLGHREMRFTDATFTSAGKELVTLGEDGVLRVWNAHTLKELHKYRTGIKSDLRMSLSSDATKAAILGDGATLRIFSLGESTAPRLISDAQRTPNSTRFSPDGSCLAMADHLTRLRLVDCVSGRTVMNLSPLQDAITSIAFSPDGGRVAAGSILGTVGIWSTDSGRDLLCFEAHQGGVKSLEFSSDGAQLLSAGADGVARTWDSQIGAEIGAFRGHAGAVNAARYANGGSRVITASDDHTARIWSAQSGEELAVLRGHTRAVSDVCVSSTNSLVVTASEDGTMGFWDAASQRNVFMASCDEGNVSRVSFSQDGSRLVAAGPDHLVQVWDPSRFALVDTFRAGSPVWSAELSPDGTHLAAASVDGSVRIWSALSHRDRHRHAEAIDARLTMMRARLQELASVRPALNDLRNEWLRGPFSSAMERVAARAVFVGYEEHAFDSARVVYEEADGVLWDRSMNLDLVIGLADKCVQTLRVFPDAPDHRRHLGLAYYRLGKFEDAAQELRRVEEQHRNARDERPTDWCILAMISMKLGNHKDANDALIRARELADLESFRGNAKVARALAEAELEVAAASRPAKK